MIVINYNIKVVVYLKSLIANRLFGNKAIVGKWKYWTEYVTSRSEEFKFHLRSNALS